MRYYAEYTETWKSFGSYWERSWQVFDREISDPPETCLCIAMCRNRAVAFKIRDALNSLELAVDTKGFKI